MACPVSDDLQIGHVLRGVNYLWILVDRCFELPFQDWPPPRVIICHGHNISAALQRRSNSTHSVISSAIPTSVRPLSCTRRLLIRRNCRSINLEPQSNRPLEWDDKYLGTRQVLRYIDKLKSLATPEISPIFGVPTPLLL